MKKSISGPIVGSVALFLFLTCSMPAFSQSGAGMTMGQTNQEVAAQQQEEIIKPCKDMTGWDKVACIKNRTRELFKEAHPCVAAAVEAPCKTLAGPKRAECIKQKTAECRAERKEFKAERKEKFAENHPCVMKPGSEECKAKMAERNAAFKEKVQKHKENVQERQQLRKEQRQSTKTLLNNQRQERQELRKEQRQGD